MVDGHLVTLRLLDDSMAVLDARSYARSSSRAASVEARCMLGALLSGAVLTAVLETEDVHLRVVLEVSTVDDQGVH